ncbi:MAG: peptide chain release factor 1 [Candidatus Falkowbacteria bacterium]|nr:peptide chain release factor 1 [Candidatus Falkowbacteria bacterium]
MFDSTKEKFAKIEQELSNPDLANQPAEMIKVSREHSALREVMEMISQLEKAQAQLDDNREMIENEKDPELKAMASEELEHLEKEVARLNEAIEDELHPANPNDKKNAIIEIRGGAGGDESALFAGDLLRMYSRFCERQNLKMELLDSSLIGIGGVKEAIFSVTGKNAYGLLKYEAGTHRVQRVPETEKQGRVHTSTATVVVLPEAEEVDIEIKPADLRIDTFCSSGPGGQSVNTTYSAIRILHIPTGTIVSCQDQKSQHQNREKALQVLRSRLLAKQEEERQASETALRKTQVGGGDRSEKIRTYNFPQDRITDHRIGQSWHSIGRIMDGELDEILAALKQAERDELKKQQ